MKIMHVITGLNVGGAETMLYRLSTHMDVVRFQSRVVSLIEPGIMGKSLEEAGIRVDSLGMRRGVPSPGGLIRLAKLIRHWRPDVVQTWLYHADLAGLIASKLAFPFGNRPKVAWNIRCSFMALDEYRKMTGMTLRACTALSRWPDMVLTNSHEAKRFHKDIGYRPKEFDVIPNGFDLKRFKPDKNARISVRNELSIDPEQLIIGQVARFDAMKDHKTMIKAAAGVARKHNATFVFAGRGMDYDNLDLAAWINQAGLETSRIRLLGERSDSARLMAGMDIHVSSSTGESFPNVVGESMACGVPNVVTDVGDSARLVGDTGLVVPPSDSDALHDGLVSMATMSAEARKVLGQKARERLEKQYGLSAIVKRYEVMYEALADSKQ